MIALYEYRLRSQLTQAQLAALVGVTPNCVTQWESGARKPDIIMLKKLASLLHCSADELLKTIKI